MDEPKRRATLTAADSQHKDSFPLGEMVDDCLGEIYKHCEDGDTKRSLRHTCRATYSSPAINSQLGRLELCPTLRRGDALEDLLAALQCFTRIATLRVLHLCAPFPTVGRLLLQLACKDMDEGCMPRLHSVKEILFDDDLRDAFEEDGETSVSDPSMSSN